MKYDLDLFVELNEEYRHRPIADPKAVDARRRMLSPVGDNRGAQTREERVQFAAKTQLRFFQPPVDLQGRSVIDVGCGHGYLAAGLVEVLGARSAVGVDVKHYASWEEHSDPRLKLMVADLSTMPIFPDGSFDAVISVAVFEHVTRPLPMLKAIHAILKDGGAAMLHMNIFTARNASHRYREVFFPWPHLLFDDAVVGEFYRRHHNRVGTRSTWVNRMTVAHYLHASREVGFNIAAVRRQVSPIDVPFYLRFSDMLGRYQALDLETDFLTLVLTKSNAGTGSSDAAIATVNYTERQRALDEAIAHNVIEHASNEHPDSAIS